MNRKKRAFIMRQDSLTAIESVIDIIYESSVNGVSDKKLVEDICSKLNKWQLKLMKVLIEDQQKCKTI